MVEGPLIRLLNVEKFLTSILQSMKAHDLEYMKSTVKFK